MPSVVVESMLSFSFSLSLCFFFFTFCDTSQLAWKKSELGLSAGSAAEAGTSCRRRARRSCSDGEFDDAIEKKKPCPLLCFTPPCRGGSSSTFPPDSESVSGGQGAGAAGFLLARVERERRRWPSLLSFSLSQRRESTGEDKNMSKGEDDEGQKEKRKKSIAGLRRRKEAGPLPPRRCRFFFPFFPHVVPGKYAFVATPHALGLGRRGRARKESEDLLRR